MAWPNDFQWYPRVAGLYHDLGQAWVAEGKPPEQLEEAIDATNTRGPARPSANRGNGVIEASQVLAFVYSDAKYRSLLHKHGYPLPTHLDDFDPATNADAVFQEQMHAAIALNAAVVAAIPGASEGEQRRQLAERLVAWIDKEYHPQGDCAVEATAWEAVRDQCGHCTEFSSVQEAVFAAAGLQPRHLSVTGYAPTIQNYQQFLSGTKDTWGVPLRHVLTGIPLDHGRMFQIDMLNKAFGASYQAEEVGLLEPAAHYLINKMFEPIHRALLDPPAFAEVVTRIRQFADRLRDLMPYDPFTALWLAAASWGDQVSDIERERARLAAALKGEPDEVFALALFDFVETVVVKVPQREMLQQMVERLAKATIAIHQASQQLLTTHPDLVARHFTSAAELFFRLRGHHGPSVNLFSDLIKEAAGVVAANLGQLALQASPHSLRSLVLLNTLAEKGQQDQVVQVLRDLAAQYSNASLYHFFLAHHLIQAGFLGARPGQEQGRVNQAEEALVHARRAVELEEDPLAVYGLVQTLGIAKRFDEQERTVKQYRGRWPDDPLLAAVEALLPLRLMRDAERFGTFVHEQFRALRVQFGDAGARAIIDLFGGEVHANFLLVANATSQRLSREAYQRMIHMEDEFLAWCTEHNYWPIAAIAIGLLKMTHLRNLDRDRDASALGHTLRRYDAETFDTLVAQRLQAHLRSLGPRYEEPHEGYGPLRREYRVWEGLNALGGLSAKERWQFVELLAIQAVLHGDLKAAKAYLQRFNQLEPILHLSITEMADVFVQDLSKAQFSRAISSTEDRPQQIRRILWAAEGLLLVRDCLPPVTSSAQAEWLAQVEATIFALRERGAMAAARKWQAVVDRQRRLWNP